MMSERPEQAAFARQRAWGRSLSLGDSVNAARWGRLGWPAAAKHPSAPRRNVMVPEWQALIMKILYDQEVHRPFRRRQRRIPVGVFLLLAVAAGAVYAAAHFALIIRAVFSSLPFAR